MDPLNVHKDEAARLGDRIQEQLQDIEKTIGLLLTVLGAAFALRSGQASNALGPGQRWFLVLLPALVFSLVMLGCNRMSALLALGGVRRWHEEALNDALGQTVLPWEERVARLERYDPAGYFVFTLMPCLLLVGSMIPAFVVAVNTRPILGVIAAPIFAMMLAFGILSQLYMSKASDRAYRMAKGEVVHVRLLPFVARIAGSSGP